MPYPDPYWHSGGRVRQRVTGRGRQPRAREQVLVQAEHPGMVQGPRGMLGFGCREPARDNREQAVASGQEVCELVPSVLGQPRPQLHLDVTPGAPWVVPTAAVIGDPVTGDAAASRTTSRSA